MSMKRRKFRTTACPKVAGTPLVCTTRNPSARLPSVAPHYYPKGGFNPLFDQLLDGFTVHYNVVVRRVEASPNGPVV